jgi:hypothetical protein
MSEVIATTWSKTLRYKRLDEIQTKYPGFYEVSGGRDSKLVASYTDKTPKALTKSIMDWLKYHGHKGVQVKGRDLVRVHDVMKYDIFSGKLRKTGETIERIRIGPANPFIMATINGLRVHIEAKPDPFAKPGEAASTLEDGSMYFVAHSMAAFITWLNSLTH